MYVFDIERVVDVAEQTATFLILFDTLFLNGPHRTLVLGVPESFVSLEND